jgi:hypothetical protein
MKPTYTIVKNNFDQNIIFRDNGDGSITSFMEDLANSDYQAYLKSLEDEA